MGDHHLQLHRPASIEKIAVPEKKAFFLHAAGASPGQQLHGASSHEAAAAVSITPRTATNKQPASPRACLCSPTLHAGSFRCRLHRGIGGGGGGSGGSVGSGLHEMSKKPGGV